MTLAQLTIRDAVLDAMGECDRLGDEEFLARHGFRSARRYQLVYEGRRYDSKAIAGVAYGYQFPERGPLRPSEFVGGMGGAAGRLRRLGFEVADEEPTPPPTPAPVARSAPLRPVRSTPPTLPTTVDVAVTAVLLGCVKGKRDAASPAADLYTSSLFLKRRAYAEASGRLWFVLSALHGLLRPDEVVEPYDMALKEQPVVYRRAWGARVADQLAASGVVVSGSRLEVHAGDAYVTAVRDPLEAAGAQLTVPLSGLRMGEQLAWYGRSQESTAEPSVESMLLSLNAASAARPAHDFPWGRADLDAPGLYSWWVDAVGAAHLSQGLGHPVAAGLVYLGQAGATSQRSGKRSAATLRSRITANHLRGGIRSSTWRATLSAGLSGDAIHVPPGGWDRSCEDALTSWMHAHLSLIAVPVRDATQLGVLEHDVLESLDPPLNLRDVPTTALRRALSARRPR